MFWPRYYPYHVFDLTIYLKKNPTLNEIVQQPCNIIRLYTESHCDASSWRATVVQLPELETFDAAENAQPVYLHVLHQRSVQHGRAATTLPDQTL